MRRGSLIHEPGGTESGEVRPVSGGSQCGTRPPAARGWRSQPRPLPRGRPRAACSEVVLGSPRGRGPRGPPVRRAATRRRSDPPRLGVSLHKASRPARVSPSHADLMQRVSSARSPRARMPGILGFGVRMRYRGSTGARMRPMIVRAVLLCLRCWRWRRCRRVGRQPRSPDTPRRWRCTRRRRAAAAASGWST